MNTLTAPLPSIVGARFLNKVAVVTDASGSIGTSIAKRLAAEGASVVVNYSSDGASATRAVDEIVRDGGDAIAVCASLTDAYEVARMFDDVRTKYGRVDVLVNNASRRSTEPPATRSRAGLGRLAGSGISGSPQATKASLALFPSTGGSIVAFSSATGTFAPPGASPHTNVRDAADAVVRSLAKELASRKIRVNCVRPGFIEAGGTSRGDVASRGAESSAVTSTPVEHAGRVDDIAASVAFLASEEARWITGESLLVAGGSEREWL